MPLEAKELEKGSVPIEFISVPASAPPAASEKEVRRAVVEQPVTVSIAKVGEFTLMCTPVDVEALAIGFAFSEGIVDSIDDVTSIDHFSQKPGVVALEVKTVSGRAVRGNMMVAGSGGWCGAKNIERTLSDMPAVGASLRISKQILLQMTDKLWELQKIHPVTRGAHAAGIFTAEGEILAFAEDIGRHNALDKAIGKCLIARLPLRGRGAVLSSRVSFEMVAKAARAGVEMVIAAAAPSSLAIEAASRWNLAICGLARSGRANLYTHPQRVDLSA